MLSVYLRSTINHIRARQAYSKAFLVLLNSVNMLNLMIKMIETITETIEQEYKVHVLHKAQ
jgi:hypothetical protein